MSNLGIVRQRAKTLSVMLTYACPAECQDCGTVSSPRDRNNLALDAVLQSIEEAARLKFENVVFTGGESTLRWSDLLSAIRFAQAHGLPTRLVTNAHWAVSIEEAGLKLDEMLEAGLNEINFSTGDQHARFIPLEHVLNAAIATVRRGLVAHIMVELRADSRITQSSVLSHPLVSQLPSHESKLIRPTESPWMPLRPEKIAKYPLGVAIDRSNLSKCMGCESVLQTYVLQADGRVGACCGLGMRITPELSVGKTGCAQTIEQAIEAAEEDFLKIWLRYLGPEKILAWASTIDHSIEWEGKYAHRCQSCLRIYRDPAVRAVIQGHHGEALADVVQSAWMQEAYIPEKLAEFAPTNAESDNS